MVEYIDRKKIVFPKLEEINGGSTMPGGNLTIHDLRRNNRQKILERIYFAGSVSRIDLSQYCGLSFSTVATVVNELILKGIISESGFEESQGGRPRMILSINPTFGYFIGIDIGETYIRIELFDLTLNKLHSLFFSLDTVQNSAAKNTDCIIEGIDNLLNKAGIARENIIGIGVGVPGLVDCPDDWSFSVPEPGRQNVPLLALLKDRLAVPIFQENGAKTMALAEMWFKTDEKVDSMIAVLIGTGVGAGIISHGSLYRGVSNSAGECGHMTIEMNGRLCRCGNKGCLEAYIGAPGIIQRLRELDPQSPLLASKDEMTIIMAIVKAAAKQDPSATKILADTAEYLSVGLTNMINMFNPQLITIGGCVGLLVAELILPRVISLVESAALKQPMKSLKIGLCKLGDDGVSFGAATLVLDNFLRNESHYDKYKSMLKAQNFKVPQVAVK